MNCCMVWMLFLAVLVSFVAGNTECVWATGRLICHQNQTRVLNAVVSLYDQDGPSKAKIIFDRFDPDDKMGFAVVDNVDGYFTVEGCANDFDWIPGYKNKPEVYIRVHHYCKTTEGSELTVRPTFRVFVPRTYDYHINHPIVLD